MLPNTEKATAVPASWRPGQRRDAGYHPAMPEFTLELASVVAVTFAAIMTVGFAWRERKWGPVLMMVGIVGFLAIIAYGIVPKF